MKPYDLQKIVKNAFANNREDELRPYLADDCKYISEYANRSFEGAEEIIFKMKMVSGNLNGKSAYSCEIVDLNDFCLPDDLVAAYKAEDCQLCEYGVLMYQFSETTPAAVCITFVNSEGKICKMVLSRNKSLFNIHFYGEELDTDSPNDVPATVLLNATNRRSESSKYYNRTIYIWRQADMFIQKTLKNKGYHIQKTNPLTDCIEYLCYNAGKEYAIYLYAYGREKTVELTGKYCNKLKDMPTAQNKIVLVAQLNVHRMLADNNVYYRFRDEKGKDIESVDLWKIDDVGKGPALVYYPGEGIQKRMMEFMYAFNNESLDTYLDILAKDSLVLHGYDFKGNIRNSQSLVDLQDMHKEYGLLKIGYTRKGEYYTRTLYLEKYGYFHFRTDAQNKISEITTYSFDDTMYDEFVKTQDREDIKMYAKVPALKEIKPLTTENYEPFSMKLIFENGETKKFAISDSDDNPKNARVYYDGYLFDREIWNSAVIVPYTVRNCFNYPRRKQSILFQNGYTLSTHWCYMNCPDFYEPEICNETLFEDNEIEIKRVWKVKANAIYADESTHLVKTLFKGTAFNYDGISSFISLQGNRITNLDFDYISDFNDGFAIVGVQGNGYGYLNQQGKLVVPAIYDQAEAFQENKALVKQNDKWFFIDESGSEIPMKALKDNNYEVIDSFREGMCKVSTMKIGYRDLAYHSDHECYAGMWGYIDDKGEEVIPPQYIYAHSFKSGVAIVCKGNWTRDEKWDNECNTGRYWTEEELWGVIDKTGKEVIPCIYDEINRFSETSDIFAVHTGGWEKGKWGIVDRNGNWLTQPIFEDVGYECINGLFAFYEKNPWDDEDGVPAGVYDIKQQKVLFEPQFIDVTFMEDGNICAEVYDENQDRTIEKIIDRSGKELFPSVYSSISTWKDPYEVTIWDKEGSKHGLIDKEGNVILPCKKHIVWNGISYDKKLAICDLFGRLGVVDFNDNIVVPLVYRNVSGINNPLLTVSDGEKDNQLQGLVKHDGTVVIAPEHQRIVWCNGNYLLCSNEGECEVWQYIKK